jgi:hypothetical protein
MKNSRRILLLVFVSMILASGQALAQGQSAKDGKFASEAAGASSVRWNIAGPFSGGTLTIAAPDGRSFRKEFGPGGSPEFSVFDRQGERLPDGVYTYEIRLSNPSTVSAKELKAARGNDDDSEADRTGRKRAVVSGPVQSGAFTILNGQVIVAGSLQEAPQVGKANAEQPRTVSQVMSGNTVNRLRNHRLSLTPYFDQVIPDDLIVQGSICAGLDCVNGEVFNFDTIRMKENNTRLSFNDTSSSAGFPTEDWTIRANSSASGGGSFLAFVDRGANSTGDESGTIVFEVDAGAPANSVRVAGNGKVGFRTATPVLDLHMNTNDTPAVRFEQNNSGGFTAQTWDIGANEANWFVRDVTSGSRLPLRIRPGAPTSSLDISTVGDVGINTTSPQNYGLAAKVLEVQGTAQRGLLSLSSTNTGTNGVAGTIMFGNAATRLAQITSIADGATNSGNLLFLTVNAGTEGTRMFIDHLGNVGIGTSAPTDLLSVNGNASKPGGGSWSVFSDERLKNIKGRYQAGLSAVMQLRPLRYNYKPNNPAGLKSGEEYVGFGAQELQKVIPEAVSRNANGYLQVNNDPILWTMLNAIQEQQKEIAQLKAEVQKLRATSHRRRR